VSPPEGAFVSLVWPEVKRALRNLFLAEVSGRYREEFIFLVLDRAGWQGAGDWRAGELAFVSSTRPPSGTQPPRASRGGVAGKVARPSSV
jgi:hypothetical protein